MLFDIRGRRKHVVRVVYAILALLMGASLFLVVGPVSIGNLLGNGSTTQRRQGPRRTGRTDRTQTAPRPDQRSAAALPDPDPDRRRQQRSPKSTRKPARPSSRPEGREELSRAVEAWSSYLKQAKEPNPSAALLVVRHLLQSRRILAAASKKPSTNVEKAREDPAHRRRSAADGQLADHPGDLRVLLRQLRRGRQGDEGSEGPRPGQVGSERSQQTDGRIPQARQGIPESRRRKSPNKKGPSARKPWKTPSAASAAAAAPSANRTRESRTSVFTRARSPRVPALCSCMGSSTRRTSRST